MRHTTIPPSHPALALWGKRDPLSYPLIAHLIDAGATARTLVEWWLPDALRRRLERLVGAEGTAPLVEIVVIAAALHDLGKATPVFQTQRLSRRGELADVVEELRACGLAPHQPRQPAGELDRAALARHELATAVWLAGGLSSATDGDLAAIVAGHHGRWRTLDDDVSVECLAAAEHYQKLLDDPAWRDAVELVRDLALHITTSDSQAAGRVAVAHGAAIPLVTGLVCLADWLASSDSSVRHGQDVWREASGPSGVDLDAFYQRRRSWLADHARALLGEPRHPRKPFPAVFGFEPSTPVQQQLVRPAARGLTVCMAPMGTGKTEAALGAWMENRDAGEGLLFALPTMSTADAMLERVRDTFVHCEDPVLATLAHGRALLNSFYQLPERDYALGGVDDESSGDADAGLTPSSWLTGRHRALLAPVAITTVDQLLAAVITHRYGFVRMLGAATHTLVIDEVHSYDAYMSRLLEQLLEWAGLLQLNVILLSATLPATRLEAYLRAYARGADIPAEGAAHAAADPPYPAAAGANADDGVYITALPDTGDGTRHVAVEYREATQPEDGLWKAAAEAAERWPTAKIGVLSNTVPTAQAVARKAAEAGWDPVVLHARMPARMRRSRLTDALDLFGKHAGSGEPRLLCATQLAEQSLDVDVDVLVTELCPAASLLQRIGRLWRHQRGRPDGLTPTTYVVHSPAPGSEPHSCLPYSAAEVAKTWTDALGGGNRARIALPDDVQEMVDAADISFGDLDHHDATISDAAGEHIAATIASTQTAARRVIRSPHSLERGRRRHLEELTSGDLGDAESATRLITQPTVTVLPVGEGEWAWSGPLPDDPDRAEVLDLLDHCAPVSGGLAARVLHAVDDAAHGARRVPWSHRLLSEVVVVDIDRGDLLAIDDLVGITAAT